MTHDSWHWLSYIFTKTTKRKQMQIHLLRNKLNSDSTPERDSRKKLWSKLKTHPLPKKPAGV